MVLVLGLVSKTITPSMSGGVIDAMLTTEVRHESINSISKTTLVEIAG